MRLYLAAPTKAALLAAVVPAAAEILAAPSSARLTERLGWIAGRARETDRGLVHRLDKAVKLSAPLQNAWQAAVDSGGSFSTRTGLRHGATDRFSFRGDNLPQLLWPGIYDSEFAEVFTHNNRDNARCFCSVALVKLATGATWSGAGVALGLGDLATQRQTNHLAGTLTKSGSSQEFGDRLLRLAQRIEEQSIPRIDYGERRRAFSKFNLIDSRKWTHLCEASSIGVGGQGRRRWATVWVWGEATGSDVRLHPSLQGPHAANLREMYRRFLTRELPLLRDELTKHAASLLARTGAD